MNKLLPKMAYSLLFIALLSAPAFAGEFEERLAAAKEQTMPALIEFGSPWCIPCVQMEPVLKKIDEQYKGKLSVIIVDVTERRDLSRQYGIRFIPVLVFLDKNGKEIKRLFGASSFQEITAVLEEQGL